MLLKKILKVIENMIKWDLLFSIATSQLQINFFLIPKFLVSNLVRNTLVEYYRLF